MKLIKIRSVYSTKIYIDNYADMAAINSTDVLKRNVIKNYGNCDLRVYHHGSEGYINLDCVAELSPFEVPFIENDATKFSDAELMTKRVYMLCRTNGQNLGLNGTNYSTTIDEESALRIMANAEIID